MPFNVPWEQPLPTYHPKLLLVEQNSGKYVLVVSTANPSEDDLKRSRNLAVSLKLAPKSAEQIRKWIVARPRDRALCLWADGDRFERVLGAANNLSTLRQIQQTVIRCQKCASNSVETDEWLVASPFWSPGTAKELLGANSDNTLEAYFRSDEVWRSIATSLNRSALNRVAAFELQSAGRGAPWHHKVVAWRCCNSPGFRSALYLGSANATVSGLGGKIGRAVNWESGVIWLGHRGLWEYARVVARAGYSAKKLARPHASNLKVADTDEFGFNDEDLRRGCAAYGVKCYRVNRRARTIKRLSIADKSFPIAGESWVLHKLQILAQARNGYEKLTHLKKAGNVVTVVKEARATAVLIFESKGNGKPRYVRIEIDVIELDPPTKAISSTGASIRAALAALGGAGWLANGKSKGGRRGKAVSSSISDIRFPFQNVFSALGNTNKSSSAKRWIDSVAGGREPRFSGLPGFWRELAREMRVEQE
jgi:hypothetical protein